MKKEKVKWKGGRKENDKRKTVKGKKLNLKKRDREWSEGWRNKKRRENNGKEKIGEGRNGYITRGRKEVKMEKNSTEVEECENRTN
jgi:hypothetical protein